MVTSTLLFIILSAVMAVHPSVFKVWIHFRECTPVPESRNRPHGLSPWLAATEENSISPMPYVVSVGLKKDAIDEVNRLQDRESGSRLTKFLEDNDVNLVSNFFDLLNIKSFNHDVFSGIQSLNY